MVYEIIPIYNWVVVHLHIHPKQLGFFIAHVMCVCVMFFFPYHPISDID